MNRFAPLILAAAFAAVLPAADDDPISSKSIFSRDRRPRRTYSSTTQSDAQTRPAPPPRSPVLIGIVREPDHIVAVFEHPSTGQITQARLGEPLPEGAGLIESMTLDYLEARPSPDATPIRIAIGQDLKGSTTQLQATTTSTTGPTPGGDDLLSRLRERRQRELGR